MFRLNFLWQNDAVPFFPVKRIREAEFRVGVGKSRCPTVVVLGFPGINDGFRDLVAAQEIRDPRIVIDDLNTVFFRRTRAEALDESLNINGKVSRVCRKKEFGVFGPIGRGLRQRNFPARLMTIQGMRACVLPRCTA